VIQCFGGNTSDELRMFPQSCLKLSWDVFRLGFIGCYGFRAKLPDPLIVDTMRFHYDTHSILRVLVTQYRNVRSNRLHNALSLPRLDLLQLFRQKVVKFRHKLFNHSTISFLYDQA